MGAKLGADGSLWGSWNFSSNIYSMANEGEAKVFFHDLLHEVIEILSSIVW